MERLQKRIAASGLRSRRAAETAIAAGRVTVDGRTASLGESVGPQARVCVDGKPLPEAEEKVYIMLNKPRGYITTLHDEKGRRDVAGLVRGLNVRLYPVGRLDMDSEGLLLMSNDGELANRLMHPSHEVCKTYETWVEGACSEERLALLRRPMELDGYTTRPAQVELCERGENGGRLSITIHEGRNRQVRRMCEIVGLRVTRLRRVREGGLELGELRTGRWRPLTEEELRQLKELG